MADVLAVHPGNNALPGMPPSLTSLPREVLATIVEHVRQRNKDKESTNMLMHIRRAGKRSPERFYEPWTGSSIDESLYDMLSLSQTCSMLRQSVLPVLWSHVKLKTLAQIEFYMQLLKRTPNATSVYGQHVRSITTAWQLTQFDDYDINELLDKRPDAEDEMEDIAFDPEMRGTERQNDAGIIPFTDLDDVARAIEFIFTKTPNLRSLTYTSSFVPLHRRMSETLQRSCPHLDSVIIAGEMGREEEGTGSMVPKQVRTIDLQQNVVFLDSKREFPLIVKEDRTGPFALRIEPPQSFDQRSFTWPLAWALSICWLGAQHGMQHVTLPVCPVLYSVDLRLLRLWLCVEVRPMRWDLIMLAQSLECEAWITALATVRTALQDSAAMTTTPSKQSQWLASVRKIIERRHLGMVAARSTAHRPEAVLAGIEPVRDRQSVWQPLDPAIKKEKLALLVPWILNEILDAVEADDVTQDVVQKHYAKAKS